MDKKAGRNKIFRIKSLIIKKIKIYTTIFVQKMIIFRSIKMKSDKPQNELTTHKKEDCL